MGPKQPDLSKETARYDQLVEEVGDLAADLDESHKVGVKAQTESAQAKIFQARLSRLDSCFDKFQTRMSELKRLSNLLSQDFAPYQALKEKTYDSYYQTIALGIPSTSDGTIESHDATIGESTRHFLKLPHITIPPFDGTLTNWPTFKDTYLSLIHGHPDLDPIQKFHYLKSSLRGAAAQTLASFEISSTGYAQAWEALLKRFDNKRILATNHLVKILNYKPVTKLNLTSLEHFNAVVVESAQAFLNLHLADPAGFILCLLGLRLLDAQSKERFESKFLNSATLPGFTEFSEFMQQRYLQLQSHAMTSPNSSSNCRPTPSPKHVMMAYGSSFSSQGKCPVCSDTHRIFDCSQFRSLTSQKRYEKIKSLNRCLNCLSGGHSFRDCPSTISCRRCSKKHHTLLHHPEPQGRSRTKSQNQPKAPGSQSSPNYSAGKSEPKPNVENRVSESPPGQTSLASSQTQCTNVVLGTALARVKNKFGNFVPVRLLIDCGSQRSFVTKNLARRLLLPMSHEPQHLVGLGNQDISGSNSTVNCILAPSGVDATQVSTSAIVIDRICSDMPSRRITSDIHQHLQGYELADPHFHEPKAVDILVGADLFGEVFLGESVKLPDGLPYAMKTIFGWILLGKISSFQNPPSTSLLVTTSNRAPTLHDLMSQFWELEEVTSGLQLDPLDIQCEEQFAATHSRDKHGRYIVNLPFRDSPGGLEKSKFGVINRYQTLERKLIKDPVLKETYDSVIQDYLNQSYAEVATDTGECFLPHHGVVKNNDATKLRVVFDGSFSTGSGSLNDHLLTGPKLQNDIREVLLRFRLPRFVMTTDISQMYLQVLVSPTHRRFLHFFYRFDCSNPLTEYQFNRLPFGLSCSPFLAIRVLSQLIADEGETFPLATKTLKTNIYIDDILTGADTLDEALCLQRELTELLAKGGFELKKWGSNSNELLKNVPSDSLVSSISLSNMQDTVLKLLGMKWEIEHDTLAYHVQTTECLLTKRGIMSCIARMYDPLGYLAPVIFKAKTVLQRLWQLKIDWDDAIPKDIADIWESFFSELPLVKNVQIPRCILHIGIKDVSVVGFADASQLGYASVVYLRLELDSGKIFTSLIMAKTKLAPLKFVSIPRLELCAALLLVNTLNFLTKFFADLPIKERYLFSDSSTVLNWLRTPSHKLKTFVAHRVTKILDLSSSSSWYHVSSEDNAADLPSRGCDPHTLPTETTWWEGPSWLQSSPIGWPIKSFPLIPENDLPEMRTVSTLISADRVSFIEEFMEKCSSFEKMVRVFALVLRFSHNLRVKKSERILGHVTFSERSKAILTLIKGIQHQHWPHEQSPTSWEPKALNQLQPFIDSLGVIRVGGRLQHSPLSFDARHPILLPYKSRFVTLLTDHLHVSYLHAGPQLLQSLLRRRYWILASRKLIRSRIHQCLKCHRLRAKTYTPLMGNLPQSRFEQGRAFINTGVDFAGPIVIKESNRRKAPVRKAYYCLFVCLGTKALHIEVVSELTTDAFLASLDRFIARRGLPSKMFSDNATNFVGASRKLRDWKSWWEAQETQESIGQHLSPRGVNWNFIPPSAPHFGGIWEAGVKSLKFHLSRILGESPLTFEETSTVAARVEAILNSRPLVPLSTDPESFDILTPGHFLIGEPLLSEPEPDFSDRVPHLLSRWQFLRKCVRDLWKKWRLDYIAGLQNRTKWTTATPNLIPGTMVVIKEHDSPPLTWPIGRVLECYPGGDGIVRVVKVRTPQGFFVRPVTKLAPLFPQEEVPPS